MLIPMEIFLFSCIIELDKYRMYTIENQILIAENRRKSLTKFEARARLYRV